MIAGIIDIGSNTIKGFIYKIHNQTVRVLEKKFIYAHLMSHIKEGKITEEGMQILINAVMHLKIFIDSYQCDEVFSFATSAVRSAENSEEIKDRFNHATGLLLDILSEQFEAYYDYVSLRFFSAQQKGIGLDLGGGSGQIVTFDHEALCDSVSLPIGALRIKNNFVRGDFPTQSEFDAIKKAIKEMIAKSGVQHIFYDRLFLIGGTATTVLLLMRMIDKTQRSVKNVIHISQLHQIKKALETMGNDKIHFLVKHAKGREYSVLPGIAVLQAVGEYFGCEEYKVMKCGVREGYLVEKLKNEFSLSSGKFEGRADVIDE